MPFGIHKQSNRSKQALNEQGTATPASSGSGSLENFAGTEEARTTTSQPQAPFTPQPQPPRADPQPQTILVPDIDYRVQQKPGADLPARSQSTRYTSPYLPAVQGQGGSADDLGLDARKYQQQQQQQQQQAGLTTLQAPAAVEPKKSKSLFDRMRSSSSRTSEQKAPPQTQASYNNTAGLARRLSKRSEVPPVIRTVQQRNSLDQQQRLDWQSAQDSRAHLPSPQEGNEDDSSLDPYLIRSPEQEAHHPFSPADFQHQTIRTVPSDSEQLAYTPDDDQRQHFEAQQHPHNHHHQHSESSSQIYYQSQSPNQPQPQVNIPQGSLVIGDQYRQQNPETVSQLSYDSPIDQQREEQQRPTSVQSNGVSPIGFATQRQEYPSRTTSIPAGSRPLSQYTAMAPPPATQPNRRPADPKQSAPGQSQPESQNNGPPPNYSRGQFPNNQPPAAGMNPLPAPVGPPGPNYRGGPPQRDQYGATGGGEQGRSTPPPAPGDRDVNDAYKELLTKYKKVKGLYFDKTAQVEQLQNTLANQRLSQSRTSLDDSEYMTRFQRLDGAITNLAFNIRKDWRSVPSWLSPYVNQDALKIGKQEMTATGRACITKFLVDEIFNRTFHPGLEGELSSSLKNIEQNIRRFSPALNNQEESDALTAKVVQWRLATLEGLKDILSSPESEEYKKQFARVATTNLTACLINFLQEQVPPGIEDSAHMIVELAVSIASNLSLESRDLSIVYPMPGDLLQPFIMKVETGIPTLENPGAETPSEDAASTNSGEKDDAPKEAEKSDPKNRKEKTKSTMLQAMMGGSSSGTTSKKGSVSAPGGETSSEGKKASTEDGAQKVRFAGFVGVEVRGRQVLVKAPVWTVG